MWGAFVYIGSSHLAVCTSTQTLGSLLPDELLASVNSTLCHIDSCMHDCRVDDYWEGYKLFCYAFYSHSLLHESEFWHCKLGALFS